MTEPWSANKIVLASGRRIGDNEPCFIIGEAGSNYRLGTPERDIACARTLIDIAAEAGCDAVKFQTFRADTIYVPNASESDYLADLGINRSMHDLFRDLAMPYEMLAQLAEYCRSVGILFMSTPFSIHDADAVDPHVECHKIASYEISHTQLQSHLAAKNKPIIFSTGASTIEDVDSAIDHLRQAGAEQLALMQCTAKYPAPLETMNVRVIPALRSRYAIPVGLSDHSRDPITAPTAAVALGANVIEKHFTISNRLPGPDHPFALEPPELEAMVAAIRRTELALGTSEKNISAVENELHRFARRGLQATKHIKKGESYVLDENIAILRPGKRRPGLHPRHLPQVLQSVASHDIEPGDGIRMEDLV